MQSVSEPCLHPGCCPMRDSDEREARIRELFPVVRKIARRVRRLVPSVDLDDAIGDGCVGLIRAVDQFDPSRGPSLEQYARRVIAGAMLNGVRRMDPVSERARRAVREGETTRYRIAIDRGSVPSVEEIDGLHPGFARAVLATHRSQPLSLDAPLPDGESLGGDWASDVANKVEPRRAVKIAHSWAVENRALVGGHFKIAHQR